MALSALTSACGDGESSAARDTCPESGARPAGDGERITSLATGLPGSCAAADDGSLFCWGDGHDTPEPVAGVDSVTKVVVEASSYACAIRLGGSVVCWTTTFGSEPESVPGLCNVTALTLGAQSRCAVVEDGTVKCWGGLNELVFGKSSSTRATELPGVSNATDVAAGPMGYTCVLSADGTVSCWGGGPRTADRPGPELAPVPELAGVVALTAANHGDSEMCAVLEDGTVSCWTRSRAPSPLADVEDVTELAVGSSHACAVLRDGSARCWGSNMTGQLGNGTNEDSEAPVPVEGLAGVVDIDVFSVDSTVGRSCALLDDGSVHCWGSNSRGSLGTGDSTDTNTPVEVPFP
ncbi:MAG TPA: hypothetical protein VFZ53_31745 [Polyangiaceae bacterium]